MKLDKQNMRNIRLLILFSAVVCLIVLNFKDVYHVLLFVLGIVNPFLWGGAVAFVMNIPLNGIEKRLLKNWQGKYADRFKRPVSIVLSFVLVICVINFVIMTVVPQLGKTIIELGNKMPAFFQNVMVELEKVFAANPQIMEYLEQLNISTFDWNKVLQSAAGFLKNGMGSMLTSTVSMASSIINSVVNLFISLILLLLS